MVDEAIEQENVEACRDELRKVVREKEQVIGSKKRMNVNVEGIKEKEKLISEICEKIETIKRSILVLEEGIHDSKEKIRVINKTAFFKIKSSFEKFAFQLIPTKKVGLRLIGENVEDGVEFDVELSQFSGGQKTLLAIAFVWSVATVGNSPLFLFDEVDSALDESNQSILAGLIKDFFKGRQIISVSHNPPFQALANRVIHIEKINQESSVKRIVSFQDAINPVDM